MDTSKAAIGRRLVLVREARGWPQAQMAQLLGVSAQRWGTYERGRSVPPPDIMARFWRLTGGTSDYVLFGRLDGMPHELVAAIQSLEGKGSRGEAAAG